VKATPYSFNPCYSGNGFGRETEFREYLKETGFNPCYSGNGFGRQALKMVIFG